MDSCLTGHNANRGHYDNGQLTRELILDLNHTNTITASESSKYFIYWHDEFTLSAERISRCF